MKTGLILEGGAMRGMFTAGVLDVFMENGIEFDGMIGVSAGAVFGCNFKSRQIGRTIRYNRKYCRDPRYCGILSLLFTGNLYGKNFCYDKIPNKLDPFDCSTFESNPMEFYVVCTDIHSGVPVYHRIDRIDDTAMDWMRASASMPMVSKPVQIGKNAYLDGGISDSIPISAMFQFGYNKNVVILTQPKGYQKQASSALPIMELLMRRMPAVAKAMRNRHKQYNEQLYEIEKREAFGELLVLRPPKPLAIGRTERDPKKLSKIYHIGRAVGLQQLEAVRNFLDEGI